MEAAPSGAASFFRIRAEQQLRVARAAGRDQIGRVSRRWIPVFCAVVSLLSPRAGAVVINSEFGTGNTNAPADDPGWANMGLINGASGIYLGSGWVLTAAHVGLGSISFGGISYNPLSNSLVTLTNTTVGRTTNTDLVMFQLTSQPAGLGSLTLASTAPTLGAPVTMIGAGRDRGDFTQWSVNTSVSPWSWAVTNSGGNFAGYQTLETSAMRWGTNTVYAKDFWLDATNGVPDVRSFATRFDASGLFTDEAQAVLGDSGGAVFGKNGSDWELQGVIFTVAGFSGQPSAVTNAVYGNLTYAADLSYYAPQIMSLVPEPSTYALLALSAAAFGLVITRRRR
jgi:hypothetical protein